jgi:hypothetical protein
MANLKITELTANTTPVPTDVSVMVDDPAGTPVTQKLTLGNMLRGGYSITTYTSDAAPTPTGDYWRNELRVSALTDNPTIAAPTGTPAEGNMLRIAITASGGTRTVGYNAALTAGNVTRTTSVPAGETLVQVYSYQNAAWVCHYDDIN